MMRRENANKKILILLICTSLLLGTGVSAQAAYSISFKSSNIEITSPKASGQSFDGSLYVEGRSSLSEVWLCVKGPGGELVTYPAEVSDGEFEVKLYLRFGKGTYTIWAGDNSTKFDGSIRFEVVNTRSGDTRFLTPSAFVDSEDEQIASLASSIVKPSMTDMEKIQAVHSWVTENIEYDYKAYVAGISQVNKASTVLEEGQGICRDYAYLVAALARALDIPARIVYGSVADINNGWEPQLHAWNELQADDRWVIVDATWDAGYIKNGKFVSSPSNKYFDPNNEEFAATHRDAKITLH